MRNEYSYPEPDGVENRVAEEAAAYESEGLPNRLLNAREVARVRRLPRRDGSSRILARTAPTRNASASEEGGFIPQDVLDWIRRGVPTKVS